MDRVSPPGGRAAMLRPMLTTVGEVLRATVARLAPCSDAARSDAEELVSRLLDVSRGELRLLAERPFAPTAGPVLAGWLERRMAGEPVQYITGRAAFRDLDLAVDRRVLIPRPETEGLVEAVLEVLRAERTRWDRPAVLDLGTGSGAIALALASEWPVASVTATDASRDALAVASANADALGLATRVVFACGDWFEAVGADERFEVVVSNPPYIAPAESAELPADVRDWEPHAALFSDEEGMADLRAIVDEAPRHLVSGGLLALELAEERARTVAAWFEGARDWTDVELRDDLSGQPRVLLARRAGGPAIAPAQWGEER